MIKYLFLITAVILITSFYACQESTEQSENIEQEVTAPDPAPAPDNEITATPANQSCIERVIALDDKLSATRNQATQQQSISKTIKDYLAAMQKVDYTSCPPNLEPAMQEHLMVWKNIIPVTDKYDDRRGEMAALFKELEKSADGARIKAFVQRSYDSWMQVSQIVSENR